jgi:hypothetical protein
MVVRQLGEKVYFEPTSIATYVPGPPLELTDIPFFMLRWSDAWTLGSLNHFKEKWDLSEDGYFQTKYKKLGWRRKSTIVIPLTKALSFGHKNRLVKKVLSKIDRHLNRIMTDRYARKHLQSRSGVQLDTKPEAMMSPSV